MPDVLHLDFQCLLKEIFLPRVSPDSGNLPAVREHTRSFFAIWSICSPALPETTELAAAPGQIHFLSQVDFQEPINSWQQREERGTSVSD